MIEPNVAIARLIETGLLGVLLILSWFIIFFLYKELKSAKAARLKDLKEMLATDTEFRTELKNTLHIILERGNK